MSWVIGFSPLSALMDLKVDSIVAFNLTTHMVGWKHFIRKNLNKMMVDIDLESDMSRLPVRAKKDRI